MGSVFGFSRAHATQRTHQTSLQMRSSKREEYQLTALHAAPTIDNYLDKKFNDQKDQPGPGKQVKSMLQAFVVGASIMMAISSWNNSQKAAEFGLYQYNPATTTGLSLSDATAKEQARERYLY